MPATSPHKTIKILLLVLAGIVLIILLITGRNRRLSKHLKTPYSIGIIINETELPAGGMAILKEVIAQKIHILNKNGGVHGHPLKAIYIDDQNNDNKLLELVEQSSRDTNVIAYVGCRGVSRSKILGPLLTERQIPFIGIYAFTHLFKDYPTMYTSSVGVKEAKLVFRELIKAKAKRIGFIGEKNHLLSEVYLQVLEELVADDPEISITFRRNLEQGYIYSKPKDQQLADSLKTETDFLLFLSNPASFNSFMEFMYDQNLTMPIYLGAPDFLLADINAKGYRAAEIYAINTFGI
ncbi:MAG: ABC transporter substrate-binding protein, partial [Bacteroidia bacterium]